MTLMNSPKQQDLEGSTEIEHTLYSHTHSISPEMDSFQKLEYIYQHFQDNEKIYESDPDAARYELITHYIHILTMTLNMFYLKMLSIAII